MLAGTPRWAAWPRPMHRSGSRRGPARFSALIAGRDGTTLPGRREPPAAMLRGSQPAGRSVAAAALSDQGAPVTSLAGQISDGGVQRPRDAGRRTSRIGVGSGQQLPAQRLAPGTRPARARLEGFPQFPPPAGRAHQKQRQQRRDERALSQAGGSAGHASDRAGEQAVRGRINIISAVAPTRRQARRPRHAMRRQAPAIRPAPVRRGVPR